MGSILTTSVGFFCRSILVVGRFFVASAFFCLVVLDQLLNDRSSDGSGGAYVMNFVTGLLGLRRRVLVVLLLAQLAPNLVPLDRDALDIVGLDLLVEPRVVENLDLGLGHELPEDQGKPPEQEQPEPGGRRRPAGTVRLPPAIRRGPCAEFLVAAVDSPCVLTQFPGDRLRAWSQNPTRHGTRHRTTAASRIVTRICQKLRGVSPSRHAACSHARRPLPDCMIGR